MRKKLRNKEEVIHFWANQVQEEGEAGNVFFRDDMIFSYGHHFCMARIMPDGRTVAITNRTYSVTTSCHVSAVRSGARHYTQIGVHDPSATAAVNIDYARQEIVRLLDQAKNKRIKESTRTRLKGEALQLAQDANEFLRLMPQEGVTPINTESLELIEAEIEAEKQRRIEAAAAEQARRLEGAKESLRKWRNHELGSYFQSYHNLPPILRLSQDQDFIETSHGARIPVGEAKRLWRLIKAVKAAGRDFHTTRRLGHYSLTLVRADGSIVVGCHDIAYSEIEGIAKELDLITEVV